MFPSLFKNVDSVLAILEKHVHFDEVKELLRIYEAQKLLYKGPYKKEKLFIVLEGLDGSGKSTLAKILTAKLKGTMRTSPPQCLTRLRAFFDGQEPPLRRAFYSLGNYVLSYEAASELETRHVIVDRFWHSTASYAIAENDTVGGPYDWPEDLLKPDVVFFLAVSERIRAERMRYRVLTGEEGRLKDDSLFRERLYNAFMAMRNPGVMKIDGDLTVNKVTVNIMDVLKAKYNIAFS
ncbi:UMP-CMP kinase 2, mitochondrial-like isoform X2 [Cimex lectularius]|nr:UMP-CMP kinase 2, mitochondrial-like isoform X2 [Cimex lectularius]